MNQNLEVVLSVRLIFENTVVKTKEMIEKAKAMRVSSRRQLAWLNEQEAGQT